MVYLQKNFQVRVWTNPEGIVATFSVPLYRGPEEGRDANLTYSFEAYVAKMHVTRMPNERLQKNFFYGELREGRKAPQKGLKKRYVQASPKDVNIPRQYTGSINVALHH